ncbi:ribonuclease H-like domain-containing protein [Aspergillus heterothallicus]
MRNVFRRDDDTKGKFGLSLVPKLLAVPGRVLQISEIRYGGNRTVSPRSENWNMQSLKFSTASNLPYWTFLWLTYPGGRDPWRDNGALKPTIDAFRKTLSEIGIAIANCNVGQHIVANDVDRDIDAADHAFISNPKPPLFLLVILPAADTAIYNKVKYVCDVKEGVRNVCVVANKFAKPYNGQYFANVALKFNLKVGGRNQHLDGAKLGIVAEGKTMIVRLDVTHPSPGSTKNAPSVAGIVASVDTSLGQWPADLRIQTPREEMKGSATWCFEKELPAIRQACPELYAPDSTKNSISQLTIVVVGKRHHNRFYATKTADSDKSTNPQNGTVVDRGVTKARNWDFFLEAHMAIQGTARPAHYYVVYDEIFGDSKIRAPFMNAADALEGLTHNMCYLFGRSTKTVSICPPAYYADLVCEHGLTPCPEPVLDLV